MRAYAAIALLAAWGCTAPLAADAASLQVEPTSLRLGARTTAALLTVRNLENRPINVQIRAYAWTQESGDDVLTPTDALRVSSPIQEVPAAGEQVIRIFPVEDASNAGDSERTFRLIVDELPDRARTNVQLVLRYSIPVFLAAAHETKPDLHFWLEQEGSLVFLDGENLGEASAQLSNVALHFTGREHFPVAEGLFGYLLPGRHRRWVLKDLNEAPHAARLSLHVDGQEHHFEIEAR